MRATRYLASLILMAFWATAAAAQSWVQVEAQPNQARATERANAYAGRVDDVNGFRLSSGWYAITLGPYSEAEAAETLRRLRAARAIPRDSFISDGSSYRALFFGTGDRTAAASAPAVPAEPLPPLREGEETQAEARASERQLTRAQRELIQIAMKWEGFYNSVIDASFGPGTRRAMAAWQEANRYEPTGILTSRQRLELTEAYLTARDSLGLETYSDVEAGIDITLPTNLVRFDRYEAPFVHFEPSTEDGVKVVLISQEGDRATMAALYDIMQTLEVVPPEGRRNLGREEFTLTGQDSNVLSHTFARAVRGTVKGFTLIWPASDEKRFRLALAEMEASFRPTDGVLPDTLGSGAPQNIDLLAGLEIRRPEKSRSGFYVDGTGRVVTSLDAVSQCARVTINEETNADIVASDNDLGIALIAPQTTLAPLAIAEFAPFEPRIQSDIAVAGYPFGAVLSLPTLTYGVMADVKGLDGDPNVQRLDINKAEGDTGGPVLDAAGAVAGVLLASGTPGRQLPDGVAFALDSDVVATFLSENGVEPRVSAASTPIEPEDLTTLASDLTVLVNCWN